jgi:hypothetical protein
VLLLDIGENLAGNPLQVAEIAQVRVPQQLAVLPPGEVLSVGVRIEQLIDKPRELLCRSTAAGAFCGCENAIDLNSSPQAAFIRAAVESLCWVLVRQTAERALVRAGVGLVPPGRLAAAHASGDGWAVGIGRARTTGYDSRAPRRQVLASVASRAWSADRCRSAMRC